MLKLLLTSVLILIVFNSFAAFPVAKPVNSTSLESKEQKEKEQVEAFKRISEKGYKKSSEKKLNFIERLVFRIEKKIASKYYKRAEAETEGFNIGGFALGFFLLPVGVIVSYVFSHDSNFRKWAWIGFGISALLLSLFALAFSSLVVFSGW